VIDLTPILIHCLLFFYSMDYFKQNAKTFISESSSEEQLLNEKPDPEVEEMLPGSPREIELEEQSRRKPKQLPPMPQRNEDQEPNENESLDPLSDSPNPEEEHPPEQISSRLRTLVQKWDTPPPQDLPPEYISAKFRSLARKGTAKTEVERC